MSNELPAIRRRLNRQLIQERGRDIAGEILKEIPDGNPLTERSRRIVFARSKELSASDSAPLSEYERQLLQKYVRNIILKWEDPDKALELAPDEPCRYSRPRGWSPRQIKLLAIAVLACIFSAAVWSYGLKLVIAFLIVIPIWLFAFTSLHFLTFCGCVVFDKLRGRTPKTWEGYLDEKPAPMRYGRFCAFPGLLGPKWGNVLGTVAWLTALAARIYYHVPFRFH